MLGPPTCPAALGTCGQRSPRARDPPLASQKPSVTPHAPNPGTGGFRLGSAELGDPGGSPGSQGVCPSPIWNSKGAPRVTQSSCLLSRSVSLVCVFLGFVHFIWVFSFVAVESFTAPPLFP